MIVDQIPGLVFHHVGVACRDLDTEERVFTALGYRREGADFVDPVQGVVGRFLTGGGPRLELLRGEREDGVLSPWLRKGAKLYHLAYEADDIASASAALGAVGAKAVVEPVSAVAFGGRAIAFFMLPNLLLVELISAR